MPSWKEKLADKQIEYGSEEKNRKEYHLEYAAEKCTLTETLRKKLEVFESWVWRRMMKIRWTEIITNEEVRKRNGDEKSILRTIQHRKHNWLGHVLRHDGMLLTILEGRSMGKRQRGRRRLTTLWDRKRT